MKYMISVNEFMGSKSWNVTTTSDETTFTSFPAVIDNPNYNAFLTSAKLTDEEVHDLEPDVWYDFPTEEAN